MLTLLLTLLALALIPTAVVGILVLCVLIVATIEAIYEFIKRRIP